MRIEEQNFVILVKLYQRLPKATKNCIHIVLTENMEVMIFRQYIVCPLKNSQKLTKLKDVPLQKTGIVFSKDIY